jgi:aryl-alcohol dehydrogenase-like predicted oxidoreductase
MELKKLSSEGLEVSALGLGCMGMSDLYGDSDDDMSIKTMHAAVENDINFFDTADMYGPNTNELLLGRFFKESPALREKVVLATKFGVVRDNSGEFLGINGRPDYVRKCCDESLKRLGVDHIDLYYQHRVDPNVPIEETVGAMADLVKAGKVKYLGLSEASADTINRAAKAAKISVLQSEYSLWSRSIENSILPACRKNNIGLVAYSPLGRGFLTGKIRSRSDLSDNDWRLFIPRFSNVNLDANLCILDTFVQLSDNKNCTPAQLALSWVYHQGKDIVPICGMRSQSRILENSEAMDIVLNSKELKIIGDCFLSENIKGQRYPEDMMPTLEV